MKNKAVLTLVFIIGLTVILGCAKLSELANKGSGGSNAGTDDAKTYKAEGKTWTSYDLDQTDIKVDLPGKPGDKTPQLPPSYKEVFSAMHIFSYDEKDFTTSFSELVPTGKRKFEIKFLADTSMTALKRQLPDLTYTLDIKSDTNAKYNGSFTRAGKTYDVRGCCVFKKESPARVWAVLTLYSKDNTDAQNAGQRIIDSVVFKDSTEQCK